MVACQQHRCYRMIYWILQEFFQQQCWEFTLLLIDQHSINKRLRCSIELIVYTSETITESSPDKSICCFSTMDSSVNLLFTKFKFLCYKKTQGCRHSMIKYIPSSSAITSDHQNKRWASLEEKVGCRARNCGGINSDTGSGVICWRRRAHEFLLDTESLFASRSSDPRSWPQLSGCFCTVTLTTCWT